MTVRPDNSVRLRILGAMALLLLCAALVWMSVQGQRRRDAYAERIASPAVTPSVDPALKTYTQTGQIATGRRDAVALALGLDGSLYLAAGTELLQLHGGKTRSLKLPGSGVFTCVAAAPDGRVLAGRNGGVVGLTADGQPVAWPRISPRSVLTSIAIAGKHVWIADAGARIVYHVDAGGKSLGCLGDRLIVPSPYLDVAAAGNTILIANPGKHRLEAYAADGRKLRSWGTAASNTAGFTGCCNPVNFALLPDGQFVTAEKGIRRVKVYARDGTLAAVVAGPETFKPGGAALDIAVNAQGKIYVLDPVDGTVRLFERK